MRNVPETPTQEHFSMKTRLMVDHVEPVSAAGAGNRQVVGITELIVQVAVPVVLLAALATWALTDRVFPVPVAPPAGPFILVGITIATAGIVRWLRLHFHVESAAARTLPDPLFALYVAVIILLGVPTAVLVAVVAPLVAAIPELARQPWQLRQMLRLSAGAALTTFVAGLTFLTIGGPFVTPQSSLRGHFIGAIAASAVMVVGIASMHALEEARQGAPFRLAWLTYFTSTAVRFQVLLLSIGPLVPIAEVLDDVEAEFAWMLFLVPLCAVYYLALVSVRLQQRTDELQVTVAQLKLSRRREAELSDYAALVTQAQEDERRRLARELHDDTAQALIALSRGLDGLAARQVEPPLSDYDAHFIGELGELANRTLDSVRRACQDLRPSVLDDLGLAAALESLAHSVSQRGLECSFAREGQIQACAPEVEVTIYRIAQEALSNARQHAHASRASLVIAYHPSDIGVRIEDDGDGFDYRALLNSPSELSASDQESRPGLGLMGMRERAGLIGAQLHIHSEHGHGTVVALTVPLDSMRHDQ
jgi:signal transduction histidine kinase